MRFSAYQMSITPRNIIYTQTTLKLSTTIPAKIHLKIISKMYLIENKEVTLLCKLNR